MDALLPVVGKYLPAGQFVHAVAPVNVWYTPTLQLTQAVAPVVAMYLPTAHAVHPLAPPAEYKPAAQSTQVVDSGWPVFGEY